MIPFIVRIVSPKERFSKCLDNRQLADFAERAEGKIKGHGARRLQGSVCTRG
jgi:hypothetical protein